MKELIGILKLTQEELKTLLHNYLISKGMNPIVKDGYIYAEGNIPILLIAHMDTVYPTPPQNIYYNHKLDEIFSYDEGIGGDDRCGIYIIMKILEELKPHVLFTEDEEIGGIGAIKAVETLEKPNIKYIIELDRKGNNDCVFYNCLNNNFIKYINSFDWNTSIGTFSDISIIAKEWNIAAVNLSSGYYNEHTRYEYIKWKEVKKIITRVKRMLKEHDKAKFFVYKRKKDKSDNFYKTIYEMILWQRLLNNEEQEKKENHKLILKKEETKQEKGEN